MKNEIFTKYFLAANSADGFFSKFAENFDADWTAYIIKGGPGTGKSSIMRRFAAKAEGLGISPILCPCSSDPDSLDAVILPSKKTIILDGTSPHIVEPKNPGLCEQLVDTGLFWNSATLKEKRKEIIETNAENKSYHKKAAAYISAAGQLKKFNFSHALSSTDINACFDFGSKLAHRYIRVRGIESKEWIRFLGGITPKGYIFYNETLENEAERCIVIRDEHGAAASIILSAIRDFALMRHHEIITIKNPILPNDIIDGILIPDLKLAFIREEFEKINSKKYKINAHRFYDTARLNTVKEKMKFNKKALFSLLRSATETLSLAKLSHDKLEKFYVEAMDFNALYNYTTNFLETAF